MRKGSVWVEERKAGTIEETDRGYRFSYEKDYLAMKDAKDVSLTLPLHDEPYESSVLFPFFDVLIPEGWLYDVTVRNWKLDRKDRFGVLLVACKDAIGNVSIWGENER